MSVEITKQLSATIAARKDSLIALRERITTILDPIPVGVKLTDDQGLVCRVARICTGASQWSNRTWEVTITGYGYITADGKLLAADIEDSIFDGNNTHWHSTEPIFEGTEPYLDGYHVEGPGLKYANGQQTRDLASRLAGAVARYIADCELEAAANTSATLALEEVTKA